MAGGIIPRELIFVVEDEADLRRLLADMLRKEGHTVKEFATGAAALKEYLRLASARRPPGLVLLDLWLESEDKGLEVLGKMLEHSPSVPVIIISGHATIDSAVRAVKLGAYDFIEKPFGTDALLISINRALETADLRRNLARFEAHHDFSLVLGGDSQAVKRLKATLKKLAPGNARVLIIGKPGTGKRACAEYIHSLSSRPPEANKEADGGGRAAFFYVPCNSMDEAEFDRTFGRDGIIASAGDCTVYLDEVSALDARLQPRLLGAIQQDKTLANVRFISSATEDLSQVVKEEKFLAELYYRLAVFSVRLPTLAERTEDIQTLAAEFLASRAASKCKFTEAALASLQAYGWPGNLWELRNVTDRIQALVMEGGSTKITLQMLPKEITKPAAGLQGIDAVDEDISALPLKRARDAFETRYLKAQLARCGGNVRKVAEMSGLERTALYAKLKKLGLKAGRQ